MLNNFTCLWLFATGFAIGLMLVVWSIALRINNLGIVDIAWSYAFLPIAVVFAILAHGE